MNKVDKDAINQRFNEAYERLKKSGLFRVQNDLATALSWNQTTLSTVLKGKRPLPLDRAIAFCDKYNVSQDWLLQGKGKMFSGDEPKPPAPDSDTDKEILRLQSIIEEKNTVIADKNKHISALEKIVMYQESMIGKANKKVAHMIHHKSRQG